MTDIATIWEAHRAARFPAAARGQEVDGVDLVLVDTYAAGCIETFVATGSLILAGWMFSEDVSTSLKERSPRSPAIPRPTSRAFSS